MPARLRVALRDLVQLLSTVGLDLVDGPGDVDASQLLGVANHSRTSTEAIELGRAVPPVELPPGLKQAAILLPPELWPALVQELVEALDEQRNGRLIIKLQLWDGHARHPEIGRLRRIRGGRRKARREGAA